VTSRNVGLEKKTWARSVLQVAWAYEAFQRSVGKNKLRREFVSRYLKPDAGMRLLDFGCGPGDLVPFVPSADFVGFDISQPYIESAQSRFPSAQFFDGTLAEVAKTQDPFDVAVSIGVLHHIPDDTVVDSLRIVAEMLKPGARFITVEPHLRPGQHWISRTLIERDRGQFVRTETQYAELLGEVFDEVDLQLDEDLLRVPYTLTVFTCHDSS